MRSKHCFKCRRCIIEYDHHCIWLNICIGSRNYDLFIGLIGAVQFQYTAFLLITILLVIDYKIGNLGIVEYSMIHSDSIDLEIMISLLASIGFITAIIGAANLYLILFHAYLKLKKMTTYQFLIGKRAMRAQVDIEMNSQAPSEHAFKRCTHKTRLSKEDSAI